MKSNNSNRNRKNKLESAKLQPAEERAVAIDPARDKPTLEIDGVTVFIPSLLLESELLSRIPGGDSIFSPPNPQVLPKDEPLPIPSDSTPLIQGAAEQSKLTHAELGQQTSSSLEPVPPPGPLGGMPFPASIRLTARDSHWLLASWDAPQGIPNLLLRLFARNADAEPILVLPLPSDNYCFLPVQLAGCPYLAQLGANIGDAFHVLTASGPVSTPPEQPCLPPREVQFAAIPREDSFPVTGTSECSGETGEPPHSDCPPAKGSPDGTPDQSSPLADIAVDTSGELGTEWLAWLENAGDNPPVMTPGTPAYAPFFCEDPQSGPDWTPQQEAAMDQLTTLTPCVGSEIAPSSITVTEEIGHVFASGEQKQALPPGISAPSSQAAAGQTSEKKSGFHFAVDTELIVYGSTEPDAKVKLAGHPVPLRPDGSFSIRLAFPDGPRQLEIEAVSASGGHIRKALLTFDRQTALE